MSSPGLGRIGVGLWTMQSTATAPANRMALYGAFAEEAELVDRLGFHSLWTAEHRGWYDGWVPAPLQALALVAARTEKVRLGTAMYLLPQHDPERVARATTSLHRLSGGRLELGLGLGHRDPEFDALGLRRDQRGKRMEAALATLAEAWDAEFAADGSAPPGVLVGGMAPAALSRAARHGHGLLLPQTLTTEEMRAIVDRYRQEASGSARIGALRDVWIEDDPNRARRVAAALERHYREEAGSWWVLQGAVGFSQPRQLDRQLARIADAKIVGSPALVAERLAELEEAGADLLVLRLNFDYVERGALRENLERLAAEVAPLLGEAQPERR